MISLWWLGLALLAAPIWWHRQKRQRVQEQPLATARFLPRADPQQLCVWRWSDPLLLLLRCLLLATAVAWLADLVLPWRGDSVLVVPGTDRAWSDAQIKEAGFEGASKVELPGRDAFGWLAQHEREWQDDARLLIVGDVAMPAQKPQFGHQVLVRSKAAVATPVEQRVVVASAKAAQWRALFSAIDGPRRYIVDEQPGPSTQLIVWDMPGAPPAAWRAPLWWIANPAAFPDLKDRADSERGRMWRVIMPADPAAARKLVEDWQRLHAGVQPYTTASQTIASGPADGAAQASGALRDKLTLLLIALFALERLLSHARQR